MAVHPVAEAFPHNTSVSADTIRQKLGDAFPLVLTSAAEIQSINFTQSNAVAIPQEVRFNGVSFVYDSADASTAHDGVACLVSQDGKRYKSTFQPSYFTNVISRTNTPPSASGLAAGDRYIVGPAPSGDWASNADDLTVFDGQDWVFVSPVIGQVVYVRDVEGQMHWGESGEWLEGAGAYSVDAESITARELAFPWGMVVEDETATPPGGTPAAGTKYIVGASATGVWSSHDTQIADADGAGGWTYYTPYDGAVVLDKTEKVAKRFDGDTGVWLSEGGAWVGLSRVFTAAQASTTRVSTGNRYAYSASVAPATSDRYTYDPVTLAHTAKLAGVKLRITYQAYVSEWSNVGISAGAHVSADQPCVIAVMRDSEVNAIDWLPLDQVYVTALSGFKDPRMISIMFEIDALDAAEHTYTIAFFHAYQEAAFDVVRGVNSVSRRRLTIEEGSS